MPRLFCAINGMPINILTTINTVDAFKELSSRLNKHPEKLLADILKDPVEKHEHYDESNVIAFMIRHGYLPGKGKFDNPG